MKNSFIVFGILFFQVPVVWAGTDEGLDHMRLQMQAERSKEEEIQLLHLDVERLKLELEKKKALLELGRVAGSGENGMGVPADNARAVVLLRYVLIIGSDKQAFLDVDGVPVQAREGDDIAGRMLKSVTPQGIVLSAANGQEDFYSVHLDR